MTIMKKRVMLVDRGLGFGGSLVVAARLARSLQDNTRFEPVVVSPIDTDIVQHHTGENIMIYKIHEPVNYITRAKISNFCKKIPYRIPQKIALYAMSVLADIANFKYVMSLAAIIVKERIDVVHINQPFSPILAALLTGRPSLFHLHGSGGRRMSIVYRLWLKIPKSAISISEYTKSRAVESGMDEGSIKIIPNPTSPTHSNYPQDSLNELRTRYSLQGKCIISIFGRLIAWKGQLQLLQAINLIYYTGLNIHILIIGDDGEGSENYRQQLDTYIIDRNLSDIVTFTGYQNDVDRFYQISDIAVHCSIEPEPFGLVITEAMQNGCAVIASSLGAGGEIITNKVNGLVVNPLDKNGLGEALLTLIEDSNMRALYSTRAKKISEERYNSAVIAHAFAAEYETLLKEK